MARTLVGQTKDTRRNWFINGDMNVAQRGTSFATVANQAYTLDRYQYIKVGAMVHTITQDSDVPTQAQSGYLFQNSLRLNLTTPDTTIATGDYAGVGQIIEGYNWRALAQTGFTISFWVKATLAGTYCIGMQNASADRGYAGEYTINQSGVWEYKTVVVPASPAAGGWNYINGVGLKVWWMLAVGATFQVATGAWQTGTVLGTANQVNGVNTGATDFRITGTMINVGSAPAPFSLHAGGQEAEFAACLRYYESYGQSATASRPIAMGTVTVANTTGVCVFPFAVKKRANTVPTFSSASHFQIANATINVALTNLTDKGCGIDAGWMDLTFSATIGGNSGLALFFNNTAGRLNFECELS